MDRPPPASDDGPANEAIHVAATRLFSERGYAGTTMREIAKSVGLLPGSLYAHIDSKEDLLREIVEAGIDRFLAIRALLDADGPPAHQVRTAIRAHLDVVAESPARTRVVFHEWRFLSEVNQKRIVGKRERYEAIFTGLIQDGMDAAVFSPRLDVRIAVMGLLGALNWTPEWLRPDGPQPVENLAAEIAEIVLSGLLI